jgi:hypothetical protein
VEMWETLPVLCASAPVREFSTFPRHTSPLTNQTVAERSESARKTSSFAESKDLHINSKCDWLRRIGFAPVNCINFLGSCGWGVGVLRLRGKMRFAHLPASLRMTRLKSHKRSG